MWVAVSLGNRHLVVWVLWWLLLVWCFQLRSNMRKSLRNPDFSLKRGNIIRKVARVSNDVSNRVPLIRDYASIWITAGLPQGKRKPIQSLLMCVCSKTVSWLHTFQMVKTSSCYMQRAVAYSFSILCLFCEVYTPHLHHSLIICAHIHLYTVHLKPYSDCPEYIQP